MTDKQFKQYTVEFQDIKLVMEKRKALKRQETRLRRKLKTLEIKYSFLHDLVAINASGEKIVKAISQYFKELGFNKIEITEKYGEEDLRLFVDNKLFIIEATGTEKKDNNEGKAHQISKHIQLRQKEFSDIKVIGLFISNHDNKKPFNQRNQKSFEKRLIEIAKSNGYTVTTTIDLLYAFINIKKGLLTTTELTEQLSLTGEFKMGTS